MTQIGESIGIAAISSGSSDPCWYCKEESPGDTPTNDVAADPQTEDSDNEDYPPENALNNDSSTLGTNLGNRPQWTIKRPGDEQTTEIVPAAHHLVPGNASLKKVMDGGLDEFMCEGGPQNLASDIGYDVNAPSNGVWLPGNYQVRPGNEDYTKKWSAYSSDFKNEYASRAMDRSGSQFHDAHSKYNRNVRKTLEKIKETLIVPDNKCPVCGEESDTPTRPPFGLVGRINFVSAQHRIMLVSLSKKTGRKTKKIGKGYYTSSRVKKKYGL